MVVDTRIIKLNESTQDELSISDRSPEQDWLANIGRTDKLDAEGYTNTYGQDHLLRYTRISVVHDFRRLVGRPYAIDRRIAWRMKNLSYPFHPC